MSALKRGETVLITGATGWVGSHVAHEALTAGLKVRLAIRDATKATTAINALIALHGKDNIETIIVNNFVQEGAFDEAIKGMQGVAHIASDVSFSANADEVIAPVVKAYNVLLSAANNEKSIRRVVFTSSSVALGDNDPSGKTQQHFDSKSWNDAAVQEVKTSPNAINAYSASKVLSERSVWDFVKANKPSFIVNCIHPSAVFGAAVPGIAPTSTGKWLLDAAKGLPTMFEHVGSIFHIDVGDVARLHIISLMRQDVQSERILALGTRFNFNILIDAIKEIQPNATTPAHDSKWSIEDHDTVDVSRANELLKDQGGLHGFEYSIRRNMQAV